MTKQMRHMGPEGLLSRSHKVGPAESSLDSNNETDNPSNLRQSLKQELKQMEQFRQLAAEKEREERKHVLRDPHRKAKRHHRPHHQHYYDEKSRPTEEESNKSKQKQTDSEFDKPIFRRMDAVVATAACGLLLGVIAISLECYVYSEDQKWNRIIQGKEAIDEIKGFDVFTKKTLNFETHQYLKKVKEYSTRDQHQEILFMVFIGLFMGVSMVHICFCYMNVDNVSKYSSVLILLYALGGALCMFCSTLLVAAATTIEENYVYSADMLYNFQHMLDNYSIPPSINECSTNKFVWGCPNYEFSKLQANHLEQIFRICGQNSRFLSDHRNHRQQANLTVTIYGHLYDRPKLKTMGFCSQDGFKFSAALFSILMGIVYSTVPIVYCCETKYTPDADVPEQETLENPEGNEGDGLLPESSLTVELEGIRDNELAKEEFSEFVEKESDEDEKYAKIHRRELYDFAQLDNS